jgi:hypothetical protein
MKRITYPKKEKKHKKQDKSSTDTKVVRSRTNRGICPICGAEVNLREQQSLSKDRLKAPWFCKYEDILSSIEEGTGRDPHSDRKVIHWACNDCINSGKALLADSREQTFCDCYPYLAYFDEQRECQECGNQYTFDKGEQQYWYEKLKFWVQSRPKLCKECYKKRHPKQDGAGEKPKQKTKSG